MSLDKLIDLVVTASEVQAGRSIASIQRRTKLPAQAFAKQPAKELKTVAAEKWLPHEDAYLRANLGFQTEQQIADHLGRTLIAVRLRWKRDLHLTAPSKHPDYLTGQQAAILTGLDNHKICHWCDTGLIPHRLVPGDRRIRLIHKTALDLWIISPKNWIYFDWKTLPDPRLRRLCELRAERWGDEWWPTVKVAEYHGVDTKDVQRLIYRGELPAVQTETSLGGRHKDPQWLNWFVLKSDAVKAVFVRGRGSNKNGEWKPSKRAVAWMKKAWKKGMNYSQICRSMGNPATSWTVRQYMVKHGLTGRVLNS
jgi:hypothetical protein